MRGTCHDKRANQDIWANVRVPIFDRSMNKGTSQLWVGRRLEGTKSGGPIALGRRGGATSDAVVRKDVITLLAMALVSTSRC